MLDNRKSWELMREDTKFVNWQKIKVQESGDEVSCLLQLVPELTIISSQMICTYAHALVKSSKSTVHSSDMSW